MKTVDVDRSLCDNHGQCAIAAPEVFRMNPDGVLEYEPTLEDSLLDVVEEAIDVCPVQAIFLKD
ncbi:ferredoxin [Arthrobacter sp. NPDC089319]|uniref:ferredoxin n=1 Tax=Arthrobacter sp. NPDC089319 TaxID=3155915 RepID=UPI0034125C2C